MLSAPLCPQGEQTVDVSNVFVHLPYIINFCNLTQVKKTSGFVRQVRRAQQAAYPLTKVPADEFVFQPPAIGEPTGRPPPDRAGIRSVA